MALPFLNGATRPKDHLLSIDLGGRTTKAVQLQRKGGRYVMSRFAVLDAPANDHSPSADLLEQHLKAICQSFDTKAHSVSLAVGVQDAIVRHTEMPLMPVAALRHVLKNNSKNYLQQDLPGHVFDCWLMAGRAAAPAAEKSKVGNSTPKARVLVSGARKQLVEDMQKAVKAVGLTADHIVPGLIGPVNAFELAMPEVFARDVVALVDIGFKNTTICLLQEGELILSRVVAIGGDKITAGLAETLGISYVEAEGIKVGMPMEVQSNLEALVIPLGRELRASIDFFEHQQDKAVSQVYLSGASARSELIVQILQAELMVECKTWNPLAFVELALPPEQAAEIDQVGPQLAVAVGAAVAAF
ncbi:MAG TPA: pilus assembly protein PilM [Verrucomicrobiae bacterium]